MKKLYRRGTVHPSPPLISDHLSFLPATILTLAAALSREDREVLAYLISCSSGGNFSGNRRNTQKSSTTAASSSGGDHPPSFNCNCFRCYTSYWVRWDSSPNRQQIHEIIDAFEDGLLAHHQNCKKDNNNKNKKERKKKGSKGTGELKTHSTELGSNKDESDSVEETSSTGGGEEEDGGSDVVEEGLVRRFVSFLGEKFWGVWN